MSDRRDGRATLRDVFAAARSRDLSAGELRLWLLYRSHEEPDRGAFPGDERLAGMMGASVRTVERYRRRLIEGGYLRQSLRGPKPALYRAILPDKESPSVSEQGQKRPDMSGETSAKKVVGAPKRSPSVSPEYGEYKEEDTHGGERGEGGSPRYPAPSHLRKDDAGRYIYPEAFEATWSVYPTRDGPNPKKGAYRKWRAQVRNGTEPDELHEATEVLARRMDAEGRTGGRYVMQARKFFGPDEYWREELEADAPPTVDPSRSRRAALGAIEQGGRGE